MRWDATVRHIEQLPAQVEVAADRLVEMMSDVASPEDAPTLIIDVAAGAGRALYDVLKTYRQEGRYPREARTPSAYTTIGHSRQELLDAILHAYATDSLRFDDSLDHLNVLTRALALQKATVQDDGIMSTSSDEALVTALGLAMRYGHWFGALPRFVERNGVVRASVYASDDTYLSRIGLR